MTAYLEEYTMKDLTMSANNSEAISIIAKAFGLKFGSVGELEAWANEQAATIKRLKDSEERYKRIIRNYASIAAESLALTT